jgi:signal transduction histidine kinase
MEPYKTTIEIVSAILIVVAFELINRKSLKGYSIMALGQFLAVIICVMTSLWFLAAMHLVNFVLMIRGYLKWKN